MTPRGYAAVMAATALLLGTGAVRADTPRAPEPVVHEDQYITVRSSIDGVESETYHLGDILSVVIGLEYDPGSVRIVNLDATLLQQSWGEVPGLTLGGVPRVSRIAAGPGRDGVEALYDFQLTGCPDGQPPPCPGGKIYRLPEISLGIELISGEGRVISSTDVNFRPSPGYVALSSALALRDGNLEPFTFYFPRRAFGMPAAVGINPNPALLLLLAGVLTVGGIGAAPAVRAWMRHRIPSRIGFIGARWERVLDRLREEDLDDETFWEGVRVAVAWYYHDQFGGAAPDWLADGVDPAPQDKNIDRLRQLYLLALTGDTLDPPRRGEVLRTLSGIFEHN